MADPNIIPFAEGAPADELMIEELADGDVLIGDPELDMMDEVDDAQFDINLAEVIDEKELARKQKLASQGTVSKSSADETERAMLSSRSLVQNLQNTLSLLPIQSKLLESKITQAERDLANTRISAPFNLRVAGLVYKVSAYLQ